MFKVANAPCSWGVIEKTGESERALGYGQMLDEMQQTGYAGTELGDWGYMPTDPASLREALEQRNLSLVAAWVTAVLIDEAGHADSIARALRTAQLLAEVGGEDALIVVGDNLFAYPQRNRVVGRVRKQDSMQPDQWRTFVDGVHQIARQVRMQTGLRTVFHHHSATWVEAPFEVATFLERTDADLVGLCLDTGHYAFGGGNPLEAVTNYSERIWHVHFKDYDPVVAARARQEGWDYNAAVGDGLFCELGQGKIDFAAIVQALQVSSYRGWIVVEQDVLPGSGTPKAAAKRNRNHLQSIGL